MAKPPKHPNTGWSFFVQGAFQWCSESFTAVGTDPNPEMIAKYCSVRCATNQHRYDKGRFVIPKHTRLAIYERDGWTCQLCTEPVDRNLPPSDIWAATLDHIVCQSWDDTPDHSPENLRLAHRWCNSVRGDETYFDETFFSVA